MPVAVVIGISAACLYGKLLELVQLDEITPQTIYGISLEMGQVLGMLFHVLKERRIVSAIRAHLEALVRLDASHFSVAVAPGYWEGVFHALNRTSEIIGQRARLIKGFSAYVANSVVEKVLDRDELHPEGELRELTILMSDLRDFTRMSSRLPAQQVVRMLNIYFADMIEVLTEHGLSLDKFIGASERMQYTMIGDPVNVAARLEPGKQFLTAPRAGLASSDRFRVADD